MKRFKWRWPHYTLLGLLVVMLIYIVLLMWPYIAPFGEHMGIANALITVLFTPDNRPIAKAAPVVIFGFIIAEVLLVVFGGLTKPSRTTHGSAHHATDQDTRKYREPRQPRTAAGHGLQPASAMNRTPFWFQAGRAGSRMIRLSPEQQWRHLLLTAGTGAGKSSRVFIPNLLREIGSRSLFIGDLKNELYQVCAGWLAKTMQVWLFAPLRADSQHYNPLAHIHDVEDAQDFAATWVKNTGDGGKDGQYWANNARLLITAMTLHLLATERQPSLARLADILTTSSFDELRMILTNTRSQDARRQARQFLENMSQNERLIGSVLTDIGNRFQLLASRRARAVTATNDIDFQEMIDTPTAFFLSIPLSESARYQPLLSVLMMQMFHTWERQGTRGIACYLDEFTNLGHLPGFDNFISTARSLYVSIIMAIQNFSQLDELYGKHTADTIKANAITHFLLPGAGLEECRYYSERIGDTTVSTETVNKRGSGLMEEVTSTHGEARRRLYTADELRTMDVDNMLMLEAAGHPIMLTTTPYYEDKEIASRANLPYQVSHLQQPGQPQRTRSAPPSPRSLPPAATGNTGAQIIVDADQDDDTSFFQP